MPGIFSVPFVLLMILVCGGCRSSAQETDSMTPLENTYWKLTHLGDSPVGRGAGGKEPHITLDPERKLASGYTGCNQIGGGYELDGRKLSFPALAMTKRACVEKEAMDQERAFAAALSRTASWKIAGVSLSLFDGDGAMLARFEAQGSE